MNEEATIKQYIGKVEYFANMFCNDDEQKKDLIQEGNLGLLSAIRNYDVNRNVPFSSYASICIKNRILDCLKTEYVETLDEQYDVEDSSLGPEEILIFKDYIDSFKKQFSELEYKILLCMLDGYTNAKIADLLNISISSVYNANQRIRQKVSAILN